MRTVDLFAGCGGLTLGFTLAGYNIVTAFDNWKAAIAVYQQNFDHPVSTVDLRASVDNINLIKQLNPEIVIGGPPCQDFSSAGKRDEELGRADLTVDFAKIVTSVKSKWFVMENVERASKSNRYQQAIKIFKEAGYGLTLKTLDASFYAVPQIRKRVFLIGKLNGVDNILLPYLAHKITPNRTTIRQYWQMMGLPLDIDHYYRHPRSYQRRGIFSVDEPSPTVRGVNRPIPPGYKEHSGDTTTLADNIRPLTTLERSYIQTFPPDFIFSGSKTDLEQMIGNAVPVKLAEFVADCILTYKKDQSQAIEYLGAKQLNLFDAH